MSDEWLKNLVDETYELEVTEAQRKHFSASKTIHSTLIYGGIFRVFSPKGYLDFPQTHLLALTEEEILGILNWAFSSNWQSVTLEVKEDSIEILLFEHAVDLAA